MDILLYFYWVLLCLILVSPFLLLKFTKKVNYIPKKNFKSEKLIQELEDLENDLSTGKLNSSEFHELSNEIKKELNDLMPTLVEKVSKITHTLFKKMQCNQCGFSFDIPEAKFCPICGSQII